MNPSEGTPHEKFSIIPEIQEGNSVRFVCKSDEETAGSICVTLIGDKLYNVSGLFVDPSKRGDGIGSSLVKSVNEFLEREKAKGVLVNMVQGDAGDIYERNGWKKGEYKADKAYGGYEFSYDARLKNSGIFPKLDYCYSGFLIKAGERIRQNVIYKGTESGRLFISDGTKEYIAKRCDNGDGEPEFEFSESDIVT